MTGKVPIREPMLCPELFSFMVTMAKSKLFEVSIEFDVLLGITDLNFGSLRANAWVASGDARGADQVASLQPHAKLIGLFNSNLMQSLQYKLYSPLFATEWHAPSSAKYAGHCFVAAALFQSLHQWRSPPRRYWERYVYRSCAPIGLVSVLCSPSSSS
jgi:hypothetical protein